jgi:predicted nucleic acid-binding Zn ribbon protein
MNARHTPVDNERRRRQRARNWAIFLALAAFVLVVYVVTIVRMKGG